MGKNKSRKINEKDVKASCNSAGISGWAGLYSLNMSIIIIYINVHPQKNFKIYPQICVKELLSTSF